jgi:hypothetical protein
MIYASLRDAEQAMNWLEKGYEDRFNPGVLLRPGFDPLPPTRVSKTSCTALVYPSERSRELLVPWRNSCTRFRRNDGHRCREIRR